MWLQIDVSFISLKLILPPLKPILKEGGDVLVLIKPQFEAGRERIGKKGIVSDPKVHEDVLVDILSFSEQIWIHCRESNVFTNYWWKWEY